MRRSVILPIFFLVWAGRAFAQGTPGTPEVGADSLAILEARLKTSNRGVVSASDYVALGGAYLMRGDLDRAREAYEKAQEIDKRSTEAQYGLACLHFKEAGKRGVRAALSHRRAFAAVRKLVETAPQFAPAYLLYGLCCEWLRGDYERAIGYYDLYLKMRPEDPDGLQALGRACIELKRYRRIEEAVLPYVDRHPEEHRMLPILGQYLLTHGKPVDASEVFMRYVERLSTSERTLYEDIRWAASKEEMEDYRRLSGAERPAFLKRFWAERDADILTEVNEGLIEHYRRVWYARTYFSGGVKPWDRRGEVYIRYGEPDYRARSNRQSVSPNPAVQRVKERIAQRLYGTELADEVYVGPVFPVRSGNLAISEDVRPAQDLPDTRSTPTSIQTPEGETADPGTAMLADPNTSTSPSNLPETPPGITYAPVTVRNDQSLVGWESWVYVNIAGGIEVTFTDETGSGVYDFAPMPALDLHQEDVLKRTASLLEFSPKVVFDRSVAVTPVEYRVAREDLNLPFYYDTADFRGTGGDTRVEVVYGLPTKEIASFKGGDTMAVVVARAVALAARDHSRVYRFQDETALQGQGVLRKVKGEFIPDLVRLEAPPGEYQMAIQIKDKVSGRTGLYKQDLRVKAYGSDRLQISDISLSFSILDSAAAPQFRKGNVYVLPMPNRTYAEGQSAAAYYEVYNLKKDARGHTRYKVEYSIRSEVEEGYSLLSKTASTFQKLLGGRKPQVSVSYEQAGTEESDAGYFTLDLKQVKPGVNRLRVTVTDLVNQEKAEKEAAFRYER